MAAIGLSLDIFCRGLLRELSEEGYDVVALTSPDDNLDALGEREGVRTIGVPIARDIAPLRDLRSLWRLVRVFRRERPDMLHTMTPKAGLLGMMAAKIAGVPVRIHTFTGLLFPTAKGLKRLLLKTTDRLTCACATHVIPEGRGVADDLRRGGITSKPLRVLANGNVRGVDMELFAPDKELRDRMRERLRIPADTFVFIFIGRFVADKGIHELAEAFCRLADRNIRLLMVGAPENEHGNADIHALEADPRVIFSDGWVSDTRLWLAAADCLVFPSYREGFPNVVLEAGAMGLPSVVTDINGSREIITHGENGMIVPPRNAEALFSAMEEMMRLSAPERADMSRKARKNIEDKFAQRIVRDALKKYYREIGIDNS